MMILLSGHSLKVRNRFLPERLSLELSERDSTASMTIGPEAPVITVGDWLQCEDGPAKDTVWRVKSIDQQYDRNTRTVNMEHAIQALKDMVLFGDVTPADITGNKKDKKCNAKQAFSYVLGKQKDWKLGDFSYASVTMAYSFNGEDLLDALDTVSGTLEDCIWEYSFASYPFTLHVRKLSSALGSEMRMDRNIRTIRKTVDRSRMYTRIYPVGKNNMHIKGNYLQKNQGTYGVVCKVETDQSLDTEEKLRTWAQERLDRHCEPSVTVTISGMDLREATGEPLDSFRIGRICRIPLPDFGTDIQERITKLSYQDALRSPMDVTITLANELQDVATILKEQKKSGGRGGRASAKNAEEDRAWFEDLTDSVGMVVGTRKDGKYIRSGEIVLSINEDGKSNAKISADTIDLTGYVTVTELNSVDARIDNLKAGNEIATKIQSASLIGAVVQATQSISVTSNASVYIWGHQCSFYTVNVNGTDRHLLGY